MYGPKREEENEDGWSLHDEMYHDLRCSEYFAGDKIWNCWKKYEVQLSCIQILVVNREEMCPLEKSPRWR